MQTVCMWDLEDDQTREVTTTEEGLIAEGGLSLGLNSTRLTQEHVSAV